MWKILRRVEQKPLRDDVQPKSGGDSESTRSANDRTNNSSNSSMAIELVFLVDHSISTEQKLFNRKRFFSSRKENFSTNFSTGGLSSISGEVRSTLMISGIDDESASACAALKFGRKHRSTREIFLVADEEPRRCH